MCRSPPQCRSNAARTSRARVSSVARRPGKSTASAPAALAARSSGRIEASGSFSFAPRPTVMRSMPCTVRQTRSARISSAASAAGSSPASASRRSAIRVVWLHTAGWSLRMHQLQHLRDELDIDLPARPQLHVPRAVRRQVALHPRAHGRRVGADLRRIAGRRQCLGDRRLDPRAQRAAGRRRRGPGSAPCVPRSRHPPRGSGGTSQRHRDRALVAGRPQPHVHLIQRRRPRRARSPPRHRRAPRGRTIGWPAGCGRRGFRVTSAGWS